MSLSAFIVASDLSFLAACLVLLILPGPTNTLLAAHGAARGLRRAALLPFAEAIGYAIAVSTYLLLSTSLAAFPIARLLLKGGAVVWLLALAFHLWRQPLIPQEKLQGSGFWPVLFTTILNPKGLLVGTVLIPSLMPDAPVPALIQFLVISLLAGFAWTFLGASLPSRFRPLSYRAAALVIAGFALATAISVIQH